MGATCRAIRRGVAVLARPLAASPDAVLSEIRAGRTRRAEEMLRLRPVDASAYYLRGRIAETEGATAPSEDQRGCWQRAAHYYRRALRAGGEPAETADIRYRLGVVLERLRHREAAASAFRQAIDTGAPVGVVTSEWWYRLARMEELLGRDDVARAAYREALDVDSDNPAFLFSMLETTPQHFIHRQPIARFVVEHLSAIHARAQSAPPTAAELDRPVFVYWGQGFALAPSVVQTCVARLRSVVPADRLHLLTMDTVRYYADLPAPVWKLAETDQAHFSDVLRAALLARYGGSWLDATCFTGPGFLDEVDRLADAEYFAFRYQTPKISSWFMTSTLGGYVARQLDAALRVYWDTHSTKQHYFLYHFLFEALYWADPEFRRRWDGCPARSTRVPHRLQSWMYRPAADVDLEALIASSFVHKLTWKLRTGEMDPDTVMAALMRRENRWR